MNSLCGIRGKGKVTTDLYIVYKILKCRNKLIMTRIAASNSNVVVISEIMRTISPNRQLDVRIQGVYCKL